VLKKENTRQTNAAPPPQKKRRSRLKLPHPQTKPNAPRHTLATACANITTTTIKHKHKHHHHKVHGVLAGRKQAELGLSSIDNTIL